jgi:hypothetical protein
LAVSLLSGLRTRSQNNAVAASQRQTGTFSSYAPSLRRDSSREIRLSDPRQMDQPRSAFYGRNPANSQAAMTLNGARLRPAGAGARAPAPVLLEQAYQLPGSTRKILSDNRFLVVPRQWSMA